jgi:hypothetical protein
VFVGDWLTKWRARHLLAAWGVYWLTLAAVSLGPALPAIRRATSGEAPGSVTGAGGDGGLTLTVTEHGTTLWSGSASVLAVVLWIAGPPLLLWLAWLMKRPRLQASPLAVPDEQVAGPSGAPAAPPALHEPPPESMPSPKAAGDQVERRGAKR